jgi:protein TonB
VLTICYSATSQGKPTANSVNDSVPDKPQANKKYFNIGGKVRPPVGIKTPEPPQEEAHSARPKFVGTTVLKFGVNEQGTVDWVRVVRSSSIKGLDYKAVAAVKGWTFQPATKDGVPVPVETNAEINFKLY